MEKAVGLRLLHRTTRKVEPTGAGRLYFERCKHIVDEARLAHEQLGERLAQPSGVLRPLPVDFANISCFHSWWNSHHAVRASASSSISRHAASIS
ncbi:MAG TPA: hypothetical protein VLF18_01305 [Tahibacter sp.]|uniref:hypothetical protein n=1 Tax=Tahibacter sp. TaxID=2056211 RepID=UPI002CF09D43|nr:hypothetical protein [Tahibacter sp.]HSX58811.1 hypothetical protein [Tahibacter sp.]